MRHPPRVSGSFTRRVPHSVTIPQKAVGSAPGGTSASCSGVSSIEHFYGVAEAATAGAPRFRPDMNYNDEVHRFASAGTLFAKRNENT